MSYVLGIDPSITATGVCLIHDNKEPEYFTIGSPSGKPLGKRLWHLSSLLMSCIPMRTTPLLVAIETPLSPLAMNGYGGAGFNNNVMAYGMAYEFCGKFKMPYIDVSTKQLKMVATGNGAGKKEGVIKAFHEKVDDAITDNNQIDAYWLAYAGWEVWCTNKNIDVELPYGWLTLNDKTYDMLEKLEIQYP